MILEGVRIGANAVRSWLQRRKQKKAEKKAAKAEAKASALEKKLFEKISPGESSNSKMALPVFDSLSGSGGEKPGVMAFFQKYWPVAAVLGCLVLVLSFFRKRRR
jgi:hypothetical protein